MQKETDSETKKTKKLKGDEFKGDALSNAIASFFHIFYTALLVERKQKAGERRR